MNRAYSKKSFAYSQKSFAYTKNYFYERDLLIPHLAQTIKKLMVKNQLQKVLDVGCGTGRLVKFLNSKGFVAFGCDNCPNAVRVAQKLNNKLTIKLASATKLPFKKNSFDLVTAISVIEHLTHNEGKKFLEEAKRVLKPKGYIFLVTPNFATPLRIIQGSKWFGYSDPTHLTFYTPASLKKILFRFGFKNAQTQFQIDWRKSLNWEFPSIAAKLPKFLKKILVFLVFTSPFSIIRNSFWTLAQKDG